MTTTTSNELECIGRIIRLIKLHKKGYTSVALTLSREQFLKYYLKPEDWEFWQQIKQSQLT